MLSIVRACEVVGLDGHVVEVQTDFNPRPNIPAFTIVGLPGSAVRESRDRVRAAIKNSSLQFPNKVYTVNLSPADLPKQGPSYDLAIAVGVLAATDQMPLDAIANAMFIGELSLDGRVNSVNGVIAMAHAAAEAPFDTLYVPPANAAEAALIPNINVIPVATLGQIVEHLYGLNPIEPFRSPPPSLDTPPLPEGIIDFADIKGQEHIKRALEIAAAGNHNILMTGSPGVGKSLMARAMPGILPRLTMAEALEVTRIHSVAGKLNRDAPLVQSRPFQAPHHTISQAGLVGGGSIPKPGAISLAHRGVLFADEVVEFSPRTLEVMRQPIEDKVVTISRVKGSVTFPANFLLVAAMNPCPCGYYGDPTRACTCSPNMITRYQARISGPLLDRIDIHIAVPRVEYDKLMSHERGEGSAAIRQRVEAARARQNARFQGKTGLFANADIGAGDVQRLCVLTPEAQQVLELSVRRMQLSARAYHRTLKLSRTIADLEGTELIQMTHVAEAIQYRPKTTP